MVMTAKSHLLLADFVEGLALVLGFLHGLYSLPHAMGSLLQEGVHHGHAPGPYVFLCQRAQQEEQPDGTKTLPVADDVLEQLLAAKEEEERKRWKVRWRVKWAERKPSSTVTPLW